MTVRWYRNQQEILFRSNQEDKYDGKRTVLIFFTILGFLIAFSSGLVAPSHFTRIPGAFSLEIKEVGEGDAGVYHCKVGFGTAAKAQINVDVVNITVNNGDGKQLRLTV